MLIIAGQECREVNVTISQDQADFIYAESLRTGKIVIRGVDITGAIYVAPTQVSEKGKWVNAKGLFVTAPIQGDE